MWKKVQVDREYRDFGIISIKLNQTNFEAHYFSKYIVKYINQVSIHDYILFKIKTYQSIYRLYFRECLHSSVQINLIF